MKPRTTFLLYGSDKAALADVKKALGLRTSSEALRASLRISAKTLRRR